MTATSVSTGPSKGEFAWKLFVELRKELVESQKVRAQAVGFKITFVTAATGFIVKDVKDLAPILLIVPAFAAIFFDFVISSYSFSIKRTGYYIRKHLEPLLRTSHDLQPEFVTWEQFIASREARQSLSLLGNLGLTLLSVAAASVGLFFPYRGGLSLALLAALVVLFAVDIWTHLVPRRFRPDRPT